MAITVGRRPSSRRDEDDRDEEPTRGSRYQRNGSRDEDEPPRRGSSRGRSRDEDDEPRGRGRGRGSDDDERPRRSRHDDDEGSSSRGRSRGRGRGGDDAPLTRTPNRGWAGSKKVAEETSDFGDRFQLNEDDFDLIAFLEDEPFDSIGRHYINELRGRKSFTCPGKHGPYDCPLCKIGDKARKYDYWLVVEFDENEGPVPKIWMVGPGYAKDIETENKSRAVNGKLSSCYFEVKSVKADSGKGAAKLKINRVRESELDAWNVEPPTDEEWDRLYEEAQEMSKDYVKFDPQRVLEDAADALDGLGD